MAGGSCFGDPVCAVSAIVRCYHFSWMKQLFLQFEDCEGLLLAFCFGILCFGSMCNHVRSAKCMHHALRTLLLFRFHRIGCFIKDGSRELASTVTVVLP